MKSKHMPHWYGMIGVVVAVALSATSLADTFYEGFNYPDGNLPGNGPWEGSGDWIQVEDHEVALSGVDWFDPGYACVPELEVVPGPDGRVLFSCNVRRGTDLAWEGYNRWWRLDLYDQDDAPICFFGGVDNEISLAGAEWTPWIGNFDLSGNDYYDTVEMTIDFSLHQTDFYFNHVWVGTAPIELTSAMVNKVAFVTDDDPSGDQKVYLDNLSLVPEPASLAGLTIAALLLVRRR